jgi:hypothetical protein
MQKHFKILLRVELLLGKDLAANKKYIRFYAIGG